MIHVFGVHDVRSYGMVFGSSCDQSFSRMVANGERGLQEALRALESKGLQIVSIVLYRSLSFSVLLLTRMIWPTTEWLLARSPSPNRWSARSALVRR